MRGVLQYADGLRFVGYGWVGFVDLKDRVLISFAGGLLGVYEARCGWGVAGLTWCEVVGVWQGDCCWLCDTAGQKAIHR